MKRKWLKLLGVLLVIFAIAAVGFVYVAPKILFKISRLAYRSTPADYGMRHDAFDVLTEDSLTLYGDLIYPFKPEIEDLPNQHTLIVLHPIKQNASMIFRHLKPFSNASFNMLCYDARGHGRSEGNMYTLGIKEADDVSACIDRMLELYPNQTFGIYAIDRTGQIALAAMQADERIQYGILSDFVFDATKQLKRLHYNDLLLGNWANQFLLDRALAQIQLSISDLPVFPSQLRQNILFLDNALNRKELQRLNNQLDSSKIEVLQLPESKLLRSYVTQLEEPMVRGITKFIEEQLENNPLPE